MRFFRFIRVRLTAWYALLLALILALFSVVIYFTLRQALAESLSDSVEGRAAIVMALVTSEGELSTDGVELPGDPLEGEHYARVFDLDGRLLLDNTFPQFPRPLDTNVVAAALDGHRTWRDVDTDDEYLRVLTAPIELDSKIMGVVEVGQSQQDFRDTIRLLFVIILVSYPLTLVVAVSGGLWLADRALAPIDRLTRSAQEITAQNMSGRIDTSGPDDELGRLAQTFDEMIERLDSSFRRQRQFTADASHELRTPLTALRGQIEVALQRERTPGDYRLVLQSVGQEVVRLGRLVGSLLSLARADAGQIQPELEEVRLGQLLEAAVSQLRTLAVEKQVTLEYDQRGSDVTLMADEDLLLQLLLNILDNALKYTPAGGSVRATLAVDDGLAVVRITDTGPGIAPEHQERIFDRFYRVDSVRGRSDGGAGLGLPISRWIAEAHGGTLDVESAPGVGTTFVIRLPLNQSV